ncbi:CRISPR-associated endonuclease Cas2 [Fodinisporobacter ferrooxydans]|uniref:CRISPR-associated endoribonuclease Cas2 n=1 Tax=Fodinisporobacter ferrooxydans TaxID=2901836 RepID=A0ABY4CPV2_9BACL|nr:CRISPR-associated endonuclease Cas2 [Alicyclobacillaceae bacterium MYW30-H2]
MDKHLTTHYVIVYDIADDRRRNHVVKALKDYAYRVQYSVFEAELKPDSLLKLRRRISKLIHLKEDSVIYYSRCGRCRGEEIREGKTYSVLDDEDWFYV